MKATIDSLDERVPRLLIPDNTPLSLLGWIGGEALDWLFVVGAEVWVTDMVKEEALRDPDPGDDPRSRHRADIAAWFERNADRIHVQPTGVGTAYRNAMELWELSGSPPNKKPVWKNLGEQSILQVLDGVEAVVGEGEAVVTIVDDRKARAAIQLVEHLDIDLMGTRSFLAWIERRFGVEQAASAWMTITMAAGGSVPKDPQEGPIYVRSP
jgi:hypothetical protein